MVPKNRWLPEFLFNNLSLVKLELFECCFSEYHVANWPNLRELRLDCSYLEYLRFGNILKGCPLLEFLEITYSGCRTKPVIASKSLKKLSFVDSTGYNLHDGYVKISCPNLEELCVKLSHHKIYRLCSLSDQMIYRVLSNSPFLHTLEISGFICSRRLVFASMSLKKLALGRIHMFPGLKISCPCLEDFRWCPSILPSDEVTIDKKTSAVKVLRQLRHVKSLDIGGWLIETLKVEDSSSLLLNCECLTFDGNDFDRCLPGILTAINCSPLLEKLVIKFRPNQSEDTVASPGLTDRRTNISNSDAVVSNCSVSNLKTVEIIGFSEKDDSCKLVFNFVEFLLKMEECWKTWSSYQANAAKGLFSMFRRSC